MFRERVIEFQALNWTGDKTGFVRLGHICIKKNYVFKKYFVIKIYIIQNKVHYSSIIYY